MSVRATDRMNVKKKRRTPTLLESTIGVVLAGVGGALAICLFDSSTSFGSEILVTTAGTGATALAAVLARRVARALNRRRLARLRQHVFSQPDAPREVFAAIDNIHRGNKDYDARIEEWRNLRDACPSSPWPVYYMGLTLYQKGLFPEAVATLTEARELLKDDPDVRLVLGQALLRNGDAEQAVVELRKAQRLAPDRPGIRLRLISALAAANRLDYARQEAFTYTLGGGALPRRLKKTLGL